MDRLSIKEFDAFMKGPFRRSMLRAFRTHQIFCEADLQSFAWRKIKNFLAKREEEPRKFRVLNKPFLRDSARTYPDLVVFRRTSPWAVIELKESRHMNTEKATREREKLLKAKEKLRPKKAYLVYVARHGEERAIVGPKGEGARYFFEVPIVLEPIIGKAKMKEWTETFRSWSKYVLEKP
jgi:hypothetical protein